MMEIRPYKDEMRKECIEIWNSIVRAGNAFPQKEILDKDSGTEFFNSQSYTGVAFERETNEAVGIYILHPNNVGRCGHICNASYAVREDKRGQHIGESLVRDCIEKASELGFRILQFNAVVASNKPAVELYRKLGFTQLGVIPGGFELDDGTYEDIIPHYILL